MYTCMNSKNLSTQRNIKPQHFLVYMSMLTTPFIAYFVVECTLSFCIPLLSSCTTIRLIERRVSEPISTSISKRKCRNPNVTKSLSTSSKESQYNSHHYIYKMAALNNLFSTICCYCNDIFQPCRIFIED
jgi:hypothetical protein